MASKKGKDKKIVLIKDAELQPAVTEVREIVKGRLNEQEWQDHLEEEEGCEAVAAVLWDVVDCAWEVVYHNWVQREVYSFAVQDARERLLQAVQWNFLSCDRGEKDIASNPSWCPDEEPERPPVDTWARGMVPVVVRTMASPRPPLGSTGEGSTGKGPLGSTGEGSTGEGPLGSTGEGSGGGHTAASSQSLRAATTSRDHCKAKSVATQPDCSATANDGATRLGTSPVAVEEKGKRVAELTTSQPSSRSTKKKVSKKKLDSTDEKTKLLPRSSHVAARKAGTVSTLSQAALGPSVSRTSNSETPNSSHHILAAQNGQKTVTIQT